jgi:hypothetical protein
MDREFIENQKEAGIYCQRSQIVIFEEILCILPTFLSSKIVTLEIIF